MAEKSNRTRARNIALNFTITLSRGNSRGGSSVRTLKKKKGNVVRGTDVMEEMKRKAPIVRINPAPYAS